MGKLHEITPGQLNENVFELIGKEWMLITAGNGDQFNMMTASWGGLGFLWGLPVSFVFIRPQRYTLEFMEYYDTYTLSFYGSEYRDALNFCGTKSGRDIDKVAETGLTPLNTATGAVYFAEARLVIECRKLYSTKLKGKKFLDEAIPERIYGAKDYHRMFVGEILHCLSL